ncbi:MAG: ABC transporter ATP-binding protein [Actinomycetota bacterium]
MTTVELERATTTYPDARIEVSLVVERARRLVLLGPSGCGKTTVLRMIAGLSELDAGSVRFDGRDMSGVRPEARDTAMVFQSHALFPFRTVAENVEYGLKVRNVPATERTERVAAALASVQLEGFDTRWPDELSGGQRQRVALARAIVVEPRVLLLDEPLSSLDPQLREELQQTICSVQRDRAITSVFVTHDRDEAMVIADDLVVMLDGQVRQVGTPHDVFAQPADDEVARFLGRTATAAEVAP